MSNPEATITWERVGPREHFVRFDRRTEAERADDALRARLNQQASAEDIARYNQACSVPLGYFPLGSVLGLLPVPASWLGGILP